MKKYFRGILLLFFLSLSLNGLALSDISLVIDGQKIMADPAPLIEKGRTLVPVRLISEELGAKVSWNEGDRSVLIEDGNKKVTLKIDSLVFYSSRGESSYDVSDVPAQIIGDRTFVPLRLISNILDIHIDWNEKERKVILDSKKEVSWKPFSDIKVSLLPQGTSISGKTNLLVSSEKLFPAQASQVRYYLLDKDSRRGPLIAQAQLGQTASFMPDPAMNGAKILFAGLYDSSGNYVNGGALEVSLNLNPQIKISSPAQGQKITSGSLNFLPDLNFTAEYVKYEMTWLDKDKTFTSAEADPYGPWTWTPMAEDNGLISLRVLAYYGSSFWASQPLSFEVDLAKNLSLLGVKTGAQLEKPVTLSAGRNFQVSQTQYLMRDPKTQEEVLIHSTGYGSYKWFPKPEDQGPKELYVRVLDTSLKSYTSAPISVNVTGKPLILLEGAGPGQVVTGTTKLKVSSNVDYEAASIILYNPANGSSKTIASGIKPGQEISWTPDSSQAGKRTIYAETQYKGQKLTSDKVSLTVYLGTLYSAKPVIERSKFQALASGLALESAKLTGMSAALQTSQAILETGWGQSLPVDKYNGKFSYNLFGIKGSGPAGSVTSNTWEEYNGVAFRTDASFRAYNNINQSWNDHKDLLLKAQRYSIFRDVMYNPVQGAWALKRAGYATDSLYPVKLINLMKTYNLYSLDEQSF